MSFIKELYQTDGVLLMPALFLIKPSRLQVISFGVTKQGESQLIEYAHNLKHLYQLWVKSYSPKTDPIQFSKLYIRGKGMCPMIDNSPYSIDFDYHSVQMVILPLDVVTMLSSGNNNNINNIFHQRHK